MADQFLQGNGFKIIDYLFVQAGPQVMRNALNLAGRPGTLTISIAAAPRHIQRFINRKDNIGY